MIQFSGQNTLNHLHGPATVSCTQCAHVAMPLLNVLSSLNMEISPPQLSLMLKQSKNVNMTLSLTAILRAVTSTDFVWKDALL